MFLLFLTDLNDAARDVTEGDIDFRRDSVGVHSHFSHGLD